MEDKNKKPNYKIIFSDLDKTLLINNHIPDFNNEAIKKARELGVKFVISTGRDLSVVTSLLKELDTLNMENEYTVCCSGSKIYENKDNKLIYIKYLDDNIVSEIFEFGKNYPDMFIIFDTLEGVYIYNEEKIDIKNDFGTYKYKKLEKLEDKKELKIIRIVFSCKNGVYLNKILNEIKNKKLFDNKVDYFLTQNQFLEFNVLGVNKGEALKWLCNYLKIDISESIAIGDSFNDESMIKIAGLGACVKSADDYIKKISKYVCEKDYFEGSVKEVIEKFILN
jgi:Cof subfamily protein (haloacid dehalogenase superfamily)